MTFIPRCFHVKAACLAVHHSSGETCYISNTECMKLQTLTLTHSCKNCNFARCLEFVARINKLLAGEIIMLER